MARVTLRAIGLVGLAAVFGLASGVPAVQRAHRRRALPRGRAHGAAVERPIATRPRPASEPIGLIEFGNARLRPLARAAFARQIPPAGNTDDFDEVPDSGWFTHRAPAPEDAARGACPPDASPQPPLVVVREKRGGATAGFVVRDARARVYVFKLDQLPRLQPAVTTGSDAIVSRLYWAVGYNTPCNVIAYVTPADFAAPTTAARAAQLLARGTRRARDGRVRVGASLFVAGEPLGPWSPTGTRADDPNDRVPHEHRRELRGERLLAAWVNHWDVRGANSLDAFEPGPQGGIFRHYMLDFGDALGAFALDSRPPATLGYRSAVDPVDTLVNAATLGRVRRRWELLARDPVVPALGYFEATHFAPEDWVPSRPSLRFANATPQDLGWMARRIAALSPAHVAAAVSAAQFDDPRYGPRLTEILLARRERVLRWGFARSSPLAAVAIEGAALCARDLAAALEPGARYDAEFLPGAGERGAAAATRLAVDAAGGDRVCARLPPHFAPEHAPDDSDARYATLDIVRAAPGGATTRLRAHVYDLGPRRGYVLAGLER